MNKEDGEVHDMMRGIALIGVSMVALADCFSVPVSRSQLNLRSTAVSQSHGSAKSLLRKSGTVGLVAGVDPGTALPNLDALYFCELRLLPIRKPFVASFIRTRDRLAQEGDTCHGTPCTPDAISHQALVHVLMQGILNGPTSYTHIGLSGLLRCHMIVYPCAPLTPQPVLLSRWSELGSSRRRQAQGPTGSANIYRRGQRCVYLSHQAAAALEPGHQESVGFSRYYTESRWQDKNWERKQAKANEENKARMNEEGKGSFFANLLPKLGVDQTAHKSPSVYCPLARGKPLSTQPARPGLHVFFPRRLCGGIWAGEAGTARQRGA